MPCTPAPPLTEAYYRTRAEVAKKYGEVATATACTLLITPHDHQGMRYHRRMIHHRTTIYCDAQPLPTHNTPSKC